MYTSKKLTLLSNSLEDLESHLYPAGWWQEFKYTCFMYRGTRRHMPVFLSIDNCRCGKPSYPYLFINIDQLDALNFIISLFQASTCFEHMCSSSGGQNCIIQSLVSSHLYVWWYYRCDDTRDCIIQFCPPDDEHICSKHVEAGNKLIIKFSASSWLILRKGTESLKLNLWT